MADPTPTPAGSDTVGILAPNSTRTFSLAVVALVGWILSRLAAVAFLHGVPPDNPAWHVVNDPLWEVLLSYSGVWTGMRVLGGFGGMFKGKAPAAATSALSEIEAEVELLSRRQLGEHLDAVKDRLLALERQVPSTVPASPSLWTQAAPPK